MKININFERLIFQYISPHRRQPVRLSWLRALIDLQGLFDDFLSWTNNSRYNIHVTSQHRSLQGHLRKIFGSGILVKSYIDQYLEIGLDTEAAHWVQFNEFQNIALEGESQKNFGNVDFVVYAPIEVNEALLRAEIEKYKLADRRFNIIRV